MKTKMIISSQMKLAALAAVLVVALLPNGFAGQPKKWEDVPEAVRATILANGGKVGSVDKESGKIDGKVVYEAVGKDKDGKEVDLVVNDRRIASGELVNVDGQVGVRIVKLR